MQRICFETPAEKWEEAFPIGNGRLGAMIFAGTNRERVQLNADSIWYGGPQNRCNRDAKEYLPRIRQLILEGNIPEAEELMCYALSGTPQSERPYQSAGNLWLDWGREADVSNYHRELDLEQGLVRCTYDRAKTRAESIDRKDRSITKEYLASCPGQVLALHFQASETEKLSFTAMLERGKYYDGTGAFGEHSLHLWGNGGEGGVRFVIGIRAEQTGGSQKLIGEHLLIRDAQEVTLYLAIETSFYQKKQHLQADGQTELHPQAEELARLQLAVEQRLEAACKAGYRKLLEEHTADYRELYTKVRLRLGDGTPDNELEYVNTYFQFVRYLCISASRPGSLPANLQGIWNESMTPPWDSKYTININTEMNYWPAESCGLSECHMPLFDLLKRMRVRGKEAAEVMYGARGFVAHHNTDIWADCAPQDIYIPASYWVMGGAWLSTHIWKHYCYTMDREFLRDMYPVLQDAVLFFHDYLIRDHGSPVTCPSVSPENTYILPSGKRGCACAGAAMDNEILTDLFRGYLKASEVLGIRDEETLDTEELLKQLPKLQIGRHGQIMEWREDYEEQEPGHRHISQLYALHPSDQITPDETPELAEAAARTLERRLSYGGGHTGWSCAWIVNLYARLFDGERAWENLKKLFEKSTFPNLMSNHPAGDGFVFQIDGNFGALSGISEMLLASNESRTILLPAIPQKWNTGRVSGLIMYGGAAVTMEWKDGRVTKCNITAAHDVTTMLIINGTGRTLRLKAGESRQFGSDSI